MGKFVSLKTALPGPKSKKIDEKRKKYVPNILGSLSPCYIDSGKGALIRDVDGNVFIDFTGGWGCLVVGHAHPRVVSAVKDQAEKYLHTDFTAVPYEPFVGLASRFAKLAPGKSEKKVAFFNCGAEAIENSVKIARGYTKRKAIIVFEGAFHGRTLLTMTMTHQAMPYKCGFGPFAPEIYRMPYPVPYHPSIKIEDSESNLLSYVDPKEVAAFVIEPIQGEGGFRVPSDGFLEYLKKLSEKYGILFVADEVQSGMGRTGKMFAIQNWGIEPDIIAAGKSIAAGLPLSAVIAKKEIIDSLPNNSIGGTFVGNPVACRAALEVLNIIEDEKLLERAEQIGGKIRKRFLKMKDKYEIVGDVRGMGAMIGIEFVKNRETKEPAPDETKKIIKECMRNGLLIAGAGIYHNVIRMLLPLVITDEQLDEGLDVLEGAVARVNEGR